MLVAEAGVEPTQFKLMRLARCRFSTLPKMQTVWGENRLLRRKTKMSDHVRCLEELRRQ